MTNHDPARSAIATLADLFQIVSELLHKIDVPASTSASAGAVSATAALAKVLAAQAPAIAEPDSTEQLTLSQIYYDTPHLISQKWKHYFAVYERFFERFRGTPVRLLEIGVSQGGSLDVWRSYFGAEALIVGVDIDPICSRFDGQSGLVRIGSQEDPAFLQSLVDEFKEFDIVIDDGGHTMTQQITSFCNLYKAVRDGGLYLVEDCHTSYHPPYGGGLRRQNTFIEFAKDKIDELNGFHIDPSLGKYTAFSRSTTSMSFFDSIVVFEKDAVPPPEGVQVPPST